MMRVLLLAALLLLTAARADQHGVTIVNTGGDTIRRIEIGASTENRLRSQLPPGATGRITYSTGCTADVRLGFDGGRTEAFPGLDICSDPRITSGQGAPGAVTMGTSARAGSTTTATSAKPGAVGVTTPVKAPPPVVPPWTGKSITKRFGGMD